MFTLSDIEFERLTCYIKLNYGINLKEEKRSLISGRLSSILLRHHMSSFTEYINYIISDKTGEATSEMINAITTNHTFFMREVTHFSYLKDQALPYFYNTIKDRDLRIWSAGCSTGEEPYTIAMIVDEFFGREKIQWDTKILATDISSNVLEEAMKGTYPKDKIEVLPERWKNSYINYHNANEYVFSDIIKNEIVFRKFNLMEEVFPFRRKFHIIFCRNVMIYFDCKTKCELINKFYDSLVPGGYLFIGQAESIKRDETNFKFVIPSVYRKE